MSLSLRQYADEQKKSRENAFRVGDDGPIICTLKFFFGRSLWHLPHEWCVYRLCGCLAHRPWPPEKKYNWAIETYFILVTAVLILAVWVVGNTSHNYAALSCWSKSALVVFSVFAGYRIFEIIAVILRLDILTSHTSKIPEHSLITALLAYGQIILCFAVFYLCLQRWSDGDIFQKHDGLQPLSGIDAVYFSTMTITTLGDGWFIPMSRPLRLMMCCELSVGLLLVVVAIQRGLYRPPNTAHAETRTN